MCLISREELDSTFKNLPSKAMALKVFGEESDDDDVEDEEEDNNDR